MSDIENARREILAAYSAMIRPLRRKLDHASRANIREALEHLDHALGALRGSGPLQGDPQRGVVSEREDS